MPNNRVQIVSPAAPSTIKRGLPWWVKALITVAIIGIVALIVWLIPSRKHGKLAVAETDTPAATEPTTVEPTAPAEPAEIAPTTAEAVAESAPNGVRTCTEDAKATEPFCAWWFDHLKPRLESDAKQIEVLKAEIETANARIKVLEDQSGHDQTDIQLLQQQLNDNYALIKKLQPSS